jgi:hypothetical protein
LLLVGEGSHSVSVASIGWYGDVQYDGHGHIVNTQYGFGTVPYSNHVQLLVTTEYSSADEEWVACLGVGLERSDEQAVVLE